MGCWPTRLVVLLAVAGAAAGGVYAVRLATHDPAVAVTPADAAVPPLAPTRITYSVSRTEVTGRAGSRVRAVIVRLTRKGTVWARLADGAFSARLPQGRRPTRLVVVLAGGARRTVAVGAR